MVRKRASCTDMVRVGEGEGERIAEHGRGVFEGYAVLAQVGDGFGEVPLESQRGPRHQPISPSTGDEAEA